MNEQARIAMMESILSGNDSQKDKIIKASQELSNLISSPLDSDIRKKLNTNLIKLNSILIQYDIKTFDDYSQMTKIHLDKMIHILNKICLTLKSHF